MGIHLSTYHISQIARVRLNFFKHSFVLFVWLFIVPSALLTTDDNYISYISVDQFIFSLMLANSIQSELRNCEVHTMDSNSSQYVKTVIRTYNRISNENSLHAS